MNRQEWDSLEVGDSIDTGRGNFLVAKVDWYYRSSQEAVEKKPSVTRIENIRHESMMWSHYLIERSSVVKQAGMVVQKKKVRKYHDNTDLLKCIGTMTLVTQPVDEFDESGLSDISLLGAVHTMNREAAERQLLDMVEDYIEDHGPVQDGQRIVMDFTTYIRYS